MGIATTKSKSAYDDRFVAPFWSFTDVSAGTTVDRTTSPVQNFTLQVKGRGAAATAWTVELQVTTDPNWGWSSILTHGTADGDAKVKNVANFPSTYFRVITSGTLTLGSATHLDVRVVARA
jgi:hypothetical protein